MATLKESDAGTILNCKDVLPDDLKNLHKEICSFFTLDDMNIIDKAQSASQFAAFVRTGYYARKRKKDMLIARHAKIQEELMTTLGFGGATKFSFDKKIAEIINAINSGMAFSESASRIITDEVKEKIIAYSKIATEIEDIQLSIDYLNDMFEVSKSYSFNINTAAKMISAER